MTLPLKAGITIALLASLNVFSFTNDEKPSTDQKSLAIRFEHFVANRPLQLDSVKYMNEIGQEYVVTKFKYYISHIRLTGIDGNEYHSDEYFLVNEQIPGSKEIVLKDIPAGKYNSIQFMLGVDSLHNCSGIQSGSLDPIHGMFWAWNTGYIFLKLDGRSSKSGSNGNLLEYHIGGFKEPSNCIRYVTLKAGAKNIEVGGTEKPVVKIKTDISEIFKSPSTIDFAKLSSVTDMHNATTIADNYADMFSIIETGK